MKIKCIVGRAFKDCMGARITAGDVRTVDVHVRRLREKIERKSSEPKYGSYQVGCGILLQPSNTFRKGSKMFRVKSTFCIL